MSSENDITEDNNSDSDATIENNQLEDHVEEKPFICVECGDCFSYKASLASHMLTHTEVDTPEQKPVVCPVCGECFTEKRDFDIHSKQHTDGEYEEFQYKECGQIVVENSANHKNENGVDKLFENKEWNNFLKESINVNIVKTLPDKEIDDTKQPTKVVAKRKRAKRTPTATNDISDDTEKQFECPQCGKFYKSNKSLKDHIRTHRTDRPFICEECGKDFTSNYNLKSHLRTHNPRRDFSCEVCGKSFAYSNSLVNHQRKHTGERPYKCTECDRRFICSSNLVSHMRVHTGDRPFKCDECGRGFSYKGELERHKRIHTGEKPYQCDICKNRYNCVGELTRHKRAHTGERPYKCDDCGKRFLRNSHLTSHIKTHTGEKNFFCEVCFKGFMYSVDLVRHTRTHTGEKPYQCHECGKCFNRDTHLKKHLKLHASDKIKIKLYDDNASTPPKSAKRSKKQSDYYNGIGQNSLFSQMENMENKKSNESDNVGSQHLLPKIYEFGEKKLANESDVQGDKVQEKSYISDRHLVPKIYQLGEKKQIDKTGHIQENRDQHLFPKIYPLDATKLAIEPNLLYGDSGISKLDHSTDETARNIDSEYQQRNCGNFVDNSGTRNLGIDQGISNNINLDNEISSPHVRQFLAEGEHAEQLQLAAVNEIDHHHAAIKTFFSEVNHVGGKGLLDPVDGFIRKPGLYGMDPLLEKPVRNEITDDPNVRNFVGERSHFTGRPAPNEVNLSSDRRLLNDRGQALEHKLMAQKYL